jgi:hypothetical protein
MAKLPTEEGGTIIECVKNLITNEEILTETKEEVISQCLNFLN